MRLLNTVPTCTEKEGSVRYQPQELIEILEESEGDNDKGRVFIDANKKTIILNKKVHLGFGFLCEPEHQGTRD